MTDAAAREPAVPADAVRVLTLAQDPAWGEGPGVRQWREGLRDAVAACGGRLETLVAPDPAAAEARDAVVPSGRAGTRSGTGTARRVRAALAALLDDGGAARVGVPAESAADEAAASGAGPGGAGVAPLPDWADAHDGAHPSHGAVGSTPGAGAGSAVAATGGSLPVRGTVLAEGTAAARAVVDAVPAGLLWCLVLPPERSAWGEPAGWARDLLDLAPRLAGVVTDSEDARDVVERVLSPLRLTVLVLPPLDAPTAGDDAAGDDAAGDDVAGDVGSSAGGAAWTTGDGSPTAPAASQLELWHALSTGATVDVPLGLDYAARRHRGLAAAGDPELEPWDGLPPAATLPTAWTEGGDGDTDDGSDRAGQRRDTVQALLDAGPGAPGTDGARRRVAVIGFDLKFFAELVQRLRTVPDLDVAVDEWPSAGRRNGARTDTVVRGASTLVAEWARPNAAWLSQVKRADQQLVVRLHRFELNSQYPPQIQIDRVDAVVYIAPALGRRIVAELGWPEHKLIYLPNFVDLDWLDRPKRPGARFTLGLMGMVPRLKRLDLALDLLAAVREQDARFSLAVRSQMPWTSKYAWRDATERRYYQRCLERIENDPRLRGAVRFDPFGRDVAAWLRGVGHVLSLSDIEGSHTALSEGMASGAVPVVRRWPGVDEMYDASWMRSSTADAAEHVLASADAEEWRRRSDRARADMRRSLAPADVVGAWADLLRGRYEQAAARFGRPEHVGLHRRG